MKNQHPLRPYKAINPDTSVSSRFIRTLLIVLALLFALQTVLIVLALQASRFTAIGHGPGDRSLQYEGCERGLLPRTPEGFPQGKTIPPDCLPVSHQKFAHVGYLQLAVSHPPLNS